MRLLFIAAGIGFTVYCFMTHQPPWLCILNVVLDVILVLGFLKDR
jgi:hypothetical protein